MTRKGIARILVRLVASGAAGNLLGRSACQIYGAGNVGEGSVNTHTVWSWSWEGDGPLEEERWSLDKSFFWGGKGPILKWNLELGMYLVSILPLSYTHDLQVFFFLQRL